MDPEHLREILDSPLDDATRPHRRPGWIALGFAGAVLVALGLWLGLVRGGGGNPEAASTTAPAGDSTASTTTTVTLPGILGYPGARYLPGFAALDAGAVMLFGTEAAGSLTGDLLDEVWAYAEAEDAWRRIDTRPRPPARFDFGTALDAGNGRVVLFGGGVPPCFPEATSRHSRSGVRSCRELLNDTWLFDPASGAWEQIVAPDGPEPRSSHALAYDPGSGMVVLYGGVTRSAETESLTYLADTWVLDVADGTWTEVTPASSPGARGAHTMAYDAESGRIVLWSGMRFDAEDPLLWSYDGADNTWTPLETTGGPEESWDGTLVDAPGRGMVLLDGQGVTTFEIAEGVTSTGIRWRNLIWHLDLGSGEWTQREPPAVPVQFQGAAGHPRSGQILVWSGDATLRYDPATGAWERGSSAAGE